MILVTIYRGQKTLNISSCNAVVSDFSVFDQARSTQNRNLTHEVPTNT